jgi:4,5-DOPA dioxygenase extradiol
MDTTIFLKNDSMPIFFIGHGSPMNAIEKNVFSETWRTIGQTVPKPKAILCISAHWETRGTAITGMSHPKTIHDFYGFPQELSNIQYPAPGDPNLAQEIIDTVSTINILPDQKWGLDHGTWSILVHMFPEADIPVLQLSLDTSRPPQWHFNLSKELAILRTKGILIIGSGNMVHNLQMVSWKDSAQPYPWATEANTMFKKFLRDLNDQDLINYTALGDSVRKAIPTPEHYLPLLYILGMRQPSETPKFFNDAIVMGSLSMTSFQYGE